MEMKSSTNYTTDKFTYVSKQSFLHHLSPPQHNEVWFVQLYISPIYVFTKLQTITFMVRTSSNVPKKYLLLNCAEMHPLLQYFIYNMLFQITFIKKGQWRSRHDMLLCHKILLLCAWGQGIESQIDRLLWILIFCFFDTIVLIVGKLQ